MIKVKNKVIFLVIIFIVGIIVAAVITINSRQTDDSNNQQKKRIKDVYKYVNELYDEDFIIKNKDTYIKLKEKMDEIKIGDKLISHRSLSEKRAYEVYYYENITISVGLDIFSIALVTSKFETARGIRVGDSIDKAFENYGVTKKDDEYEYYTYCGPNREKLIFEVDKNDIITRINLELPG